MIYSPEWHTRAEELARTGLYDPANEHDACGVGLVAATDGAPRRDIVEMGIEALKRVYHRGAVDADGKTGDGAGIQIQIPVDFFHDYLSRIGKKPKGKRIAVGQLFLPRKNLVAKEACRGIVETEILKIGFGIFGWRQVPVVSEVIGDIANDSRPEIEQIIIHASESVKEEQFELMLYFLRKRIENKIRESNIQGFYVCSLSSRTIVYKGLFKAEQLDAFYPDLCDKRFASAFAIFHQRFSTNTAPAWHMAQPFRCLAHNGEVNTLKGNVNFMRSHEATFKCKAFEGFEEDVVPVLPENMSDTACLDAAMEVLTRAGRSLPLAKLILIPPPWSRISDIAENHRDLFAFCNTVSEPWDGPAAIAASDGEWVVAGLDRGGLRPMRYAITKDGVLAIGSESGMVPVSDSVVLERGRLGPGDIIGVNLREGKLYKDTELKDRLAAEHPYDRWVQNIVNLKDVVEEHPTVAIKIPDEKLRQLQRATGQTLEDLEAILHPMGENGTEAIGSMGDDAPLAVLSDDYRPFHHFFRQNFSQVTNPPIDPLRERRVMSLNTRFGNDGNYLKLDATHSKTLLCESPVLLSTELLAIEQHYEKKITRLDTLFDVSSDEKSLRKGIERLVDEAVKATRRGKSYLVLSDDNMDATHAPIPMILAVSAVHSQLVKEKLRKKAAILVRTSECMDTHSLAVLIGSGATVVNPYVAEASLVQRHARGLFKGLSEAEVLENFRKALESGLLKIMSKMGISVVSSYRGGLNFEAIGLSRALAAEFFPGLPSRISGIGLKGIEKRVRYQHAIGFAESSKVEPLPVGGFYRYRASGDTHAWDGKLLHKLQEALGEGSYRIYKEYSNGVQALPPVHLRDLLGFRSDRKPVAVDAVESVTEIRKRFVAPAMSLGALSPEAHEILAIAMNRIGASSNSGEGGEGEERYHPYPNGDNPNSTIKQVASARFGVTAKYLNSAREIQIKIAQGAKPGEGGQLPGFKVTTEIARLRHATPGVTLISPPPHHDIYSIEDLAQLIYDLKQINPTALVSVKLVAQSGIGTIAAGVAKAMADKIVVAGHNGGTGASPWSSVKFAGIPWEMGLAEANQVLTLNRLRHRVTLQTDGGLKTGRDIVVAAMLGAQEYAIGTACLVALGCIMVRQCHSNTCPVGVTTQDPALRAKFNGTVEKVVNLLTFISEDVREILASLGYTRLDEVVGRSDLLTQMDRGSEDLVDLDLNPLLSRADPGIHTLSGERQVRNEVPDTLDKQMIADAQGALTRGEKIQLAYTVKNTMRSIGTRLSSMMVQRFDTGTLNPDHVTLRLRGSAGQSLGAFLERGVKIELIGDANDYVGKGLSGGTIIVRPRPSSTIVPEDNTIIGNTVLYGATGGKLFANGQAGERFAVRNSGAETVVEGCGTCGCEYMTGGIAVILGDVGHNFAAGMTGGMAFVYDRNDVLSHRLNGDSVVCQPVETEHWENVLKAVVAEHLEETDSPRAQQILSGWKYELPRFRQVCPKEMLDKLEHPISEKHASEAGKRKKA